MKNYHILLTVLLSVFCVSLNAQIFIEGSVGFTGSSQKTDDGISITKNSDNNFIFRPGVGKFISEKVAIGMDLDITYAFSTSSAANESKQTSTSIGASTYVRYYAISWNKFSVFGQGELGFSFLQGQLTVDGTKTDYLDANTYYFRITPGLSYDISERLQLQTSINVLSLGYFYVKSDNGTSENTRSSVAFGAGLDDIFTLGNITVGAIFKF
jgi:outer membrane protein